MLEAQVEESKSRLPADRADRSYKAVAVAEVFSCTPARPAPRRSERRPISQRPRSSRPGERCGVGRDDLPPADHPGRAVPRPRQRGHYHLPRAYASVRTKRSSTRHLGYRELRRSLRRDRRADQKRRRAGRRMWRRASYFFASNFAWGYVTDQITQGERLPVYALLPRGHFTRVRPTNITLPTSPVVVQPWLQGRA